MAGREPPPSMVPPDLDPEDQNYIIWFWDLARDRTYTSGGPGPIPWSSCHMYAGTLGLHRYEDLYEDFMHAMKAMDSEYIAVVNEEMERQKKEAESRRK